MKIEVHPDADALAGRAAEIIAADARAAIDSRGRYVMAVSGGSTPWLMLRSFAREQLPWAKVHIAQVDERAAPEGDPDRNLTHLRESLPEHPPLPLHLLPMPVEAPDLHSAASQYARILSDVAGSPPIIDLVHLGLGVDGHTASLVPGDPVLEVTDADVAVTRSYQGRRRMTLTFPIINRSRRVLWLVSGGAKSAALARLCAGDPSIPASRVAQDQALILADRPAAEQLGASENLEMRR